MENDDGSFSTLRSIGIFDEELGKEVLVPTIRVDELGTAVQMSEEDAVHQYMKTKQHLGVFDSIEESNEYAERLSDYMGQVHG